MALRTIAPPNGIGNNHAHVIQVAVGQQHALLLTDEGIVYSWGGSQENGELGRVALSDDKEREPAPITDRIRNEVIVQIACGLHHCVALSQQGVLFAWGHNKAGQLGLEASASSTTTKSPVAVKPFDGSDPSIIVRSCSCGPESSACITMRGEVYVWGAVSYYLHGSGTKYGRDASGKMDNCTVPVKVKGIPRPTKEYCPDQISCYRYGIACTVTQTNFEEDLVTHISSLKNRSSVLASINRHRRQDAKFASTEGEDGEIELEELKNLNEEWQAQKHKCAAELAKMVDEQNTCQLELARVGRELTVCDQQDTALTEQASNLEVKRGEGQGGQSAQNTRTLDTQLQDIKHFKSSNKRSKMQLLTQRDKLEQQLLDLKQRHAESAQRMHDVEGRTKLIRSLQHGCMGSDANSSIDEGLKIAISKREELIATEPQKLAGAGTFAGFREVLAISDRALQDVSSALKEVSAAVSGGDGSILEEVLEQNLKLRKEHNAAIQEKLTRAEFGRRGNKGSGGAEGMCNYFMEAHVEDSKSSRGQRRAGGPGQVALPMSGNPV